MQEAYVKGKTIGDTFSLLGSVAVCVGTVFSLIALLARDSFFVFLYPVMFALAGVAFTVSIDRYRMCLRLLEAECAQTGGTGSERIRPDAANHDPTTRNAP